MMAQSPPQDDTLRLHVEEVDKVFGLGWVCAGHVAMLPKTGDYFTIDLIGNLLVAVRSQDRIRVLSRVCLHRWASLIEGSGNVRRFTCPFHAWSYALDGRLIAAAFMGQAQDFDRSRLRLPEIPTKVSEETGLIFIRLSEALLGDDATGPLAEALTGMAGMAAVGPPSDQSVEIGWSEAIAQATARSAGSHKVAPNGVFIAEPGKAMLTLIYPNGPNTSLTRTIELRATSG